MGYTDGDRGRFYVLCVYIYPLFWEVVIIYILQMFDVEL